MRTRRCSACGGDDFEPLLDLGQVPASGQYRSIETEALRTVTLSLEICTACSLVRQLEGRVERDYSVTNRATASQMPGYVDELLTELCARGVARSDWVVEVGCNDGSLLERLREIGFENLLGFEPSVALANTVRSRGFEVVQGYFDEGTAQELVAERGPAKAVICRHTLEHVSRPETFMSVIRGFLAPDGGWGLIEVPDSSVIPEQNSVHQVWDEHVHYFSQSNLQALARATGLLVGGTRTYPHLDERNIVMWCHTSSTPSGRPHAPGRSAEVDTWRSLPARWGEYRGRLGSALASTPRPLYLIGASHPQCNFANYAGISRRIDYLIDDDPLKVGKIAPLKDCAARVISTDEFRATARGGTVLRTGFGYAAWMDRISRHALGAGLSVVDPRTV